MQLINATFVPSLILLVAGAALTLTRTDALIAPGRGFSSRYSTTRMYESVVDTTITNTITLPTAEIIGNGRIGSLLASAGNCKVLGRNDVIDPSNEGHPIFIATRNDALDAIVDHCPVNRRNDLVFLQNGYLDDFLSSKGLIRNTQVLLYLSVPSKGAEPIDGVTSYNPEGLTMATGKHAMAFAQRLEALNMKCHVVEPSVYRPAMFEKLMYDFEHRVM